MMIHVNKSKTVSWTSEQKENRNNTCDCGRDNESTLTDVIKTSISCLLYLMYLHVLILNG